MRVDYKELLDYIEPSTVDYNTWLSVGMALKQEAQDVGVWDEWSRRDTARYHAGECEKKWRGFDGSATPVTGASIVKLAKENGWQPKQSGAARSLDWNDVISAEDGDLVVVDKNWIEGTDIEIPEVWEPEKQLIEYLEALFDQDEKVGYVTRSFDAEGGKKLPTRGCWDRTAGQLIKQLKRCGGDVGMVLGDYDPAAGAWIRFNPLDGKGVKNDNVTDYRFALVESDSADLGRQNAIIRELELPVAALVYSGGKSIHAIVRIEAKNYDEYKQRVDYLYAVCRKNGLAPDTQNRNPSRLSRMPGVIRGGKKQFLIATNIGKAHWDEWRDWIESVSDDLPDPENLVDVWNNLPDLSPPLIDGVLRQGHKMLMAGPSKAGKSYALIELCCAIAEGRRWLGFSCAQGKVMYVNLELDRPSCLHRFKDVYEALGWEARSLGNIDIWNLRGRSIPMDKLAPKLIRRAMKKNYIAIIIDPIYKVITGDENSADQMAHFCNQFDKVCTELGCAVIYCHHHSKGAQGGKRSMDRASGSGVFARDPDALLDLIELEISEPLMRQEKNAAAAKVYMKYLDDVSQDDACSAARLRDIAAQKLAAADRLSADIEAAEAEKAVEMRSAWRIEGTLREYPKFKPVNVWFDYPVHRMDAVGCLADIQPEAEVQWRSGRKNPEKRQSVQDKWNETLNNAFEALKDENGVAKMGDIMEYCGNKSINTIRAHVDESGFLQRDKKGNVTRIS